MLQRTAGLLVGCVLLSAAATGRAQYVTITVDNDWFARADRHYTGGLQVAVLLEAAAIAPSIRALPPVSWNAEPELTLAFGQRVYTPSDLDRVPPDPEDRPYAGWTYLLADVRTKNGPAVDHVLASIGVVGPGSGAHQTQKYIHRLFDNRPADGWSSQLHDEVGVLLGYERAWPGLLQSAFGSSKVDVALRAGGTVGNVFTYAMTGAVLRVGPQLPDDLPPHISLVPSLDGFHGSRERGWYGWIAVEARAVARNIFLDGNTFQDSPSVDRKPFGYDVQLGFAYSWRRTRLDFALVRRSKEFAGQQGPDRYGQLALSMAY